MKRKIWAAVVAGVAINLAAVSLVRADAQAAKDYVKQAQDLVANNDNDAAEAKLELAETELDGVDADTKASLTASIKAVRDSIAKAKLSGDAQKYHMQLGQAMDAAEQAIGNQVTWPGAASTLTDLFNDPAAQAAIPDELADAKKKFATFTKLNNKKLAVVIGAQVDDAMKQLDAKWAADKPKFSDPNTNPADKQSAIDEMTQAMTDTKTQVALLPADSDEAKADSAHIDAVNSEFTSIALADKAKTVLAQLQESFASYKNEYDGWDQETGNVPTWDDYQHHQSDAMSAFNAPKSKGLISRTDDFLKDLQNNDDYKSVAAAPDMKAWVDQLKANRDKAYAQMLAHVKPVVDAAVAAGGDALGQSSLKDDVRNALGEDSPDNKQMQDDIQKRIDGATAAASGAADAQKAWYKTMTDAATAAWPNISSQFTAEEGFDPGNPDAFKGKTIKITTDNLMGYRFKPGDFEFATTLNGLPIAAHFDPALKAAIAAVEAKMGRSIGDSDDDGKWTIYAIVTGEKGQMLQRKQAEGDVKVDGEKVGTVTTDYDEPVEAQIITIVAAKCGPFVGGKDAGIIQPDGTIAK